MKAGYRIIALSIATFVLSYSTGAWAANYVAGEDRAGSAEVNRKDFQSQEPEKPEVKDLGCPEGWDDRRSELVHSGKPQTQQRHLPIGPILL